MAKRFRCCQCNAPFGFEFEADGPKCPSCGLGLPAVIPLVDVHWLRFVGGRYSVGCNPKIVVGLRGNVATGQPDAVTCPACRAMKEHKESLAKYEAGEPDFSRVEREGE